MTPEERLRQLKNELLSALDEGEDAARPVNLDQNKVGRLSRMDALQQQAMQQASQQSLRERLAAVARALQAVETGEYGYCEHCGDAIPAARLEIKPEALLCIDCQKRLESD